MIFEPTPLPGAFTIGLERRGDDRGFFGRVFCTDEFAAQGVETQFVACTTSCRRRPRSR